MSWRNEAFGLHQGGDFLVQLGDFNSVQQNSVVRRSSVQFSQSVS